MYRGESITLAMLAFAHNAGLEAYALDCPRGGIVAYWRDSRNGPNSAYCFTFRQLRELLADIG